MTGSSTSSTPVARSRGSQGGWTKVAGLVAGAVLLATTAAVILNFDRVKGWAVYHGYVGLTGRLEGHTVDLPAHAVRCANCHEPGVAPDGTAGGVPIAPLEATTLPVALSRRGGPPTTYDEASFCETLTSGFDPADILLERTMPRFSIDPANCSALWAYLSTR